MDLTSPEKRRVQKLRAGRRSPPPRRAIEDDDEEITRPDPPRPPAVRALSTGLNFKKAVRTVIQQNYGRGLSWYSLTRVDEDDDQTYAVLELTGIAHPCRVAEIGTAMPQDGIYGRVWRVAQDTEVNEDGAHRIALTEAEGLNLDLFTRRAKRALAGGARLIVVTEALARRATAQGLTFDVPVVALPETDEQFLRDEMPQWSLARADDRATLNERVKAFRALGASQKTQSLVAREALAAAHRGHDFLLQKFVSSGVDVLSVKDDRGRTALMLAATYGRDNVADALRSLSGARMSVIVNERDVRGRTAVMHAVLRNQVHMLKTLLEDWGASARTADASGSRPLKVAVAHGREAASILLLEHGAWLRTDETEAWARDVYRLAVEKGLTRVVEALYEARARVLKTRRRDALDMDLGDADRSPLLHAIRKRKKEVVEVLLRPYEDARGASFHLCDLSATNGQGRTALHEASILGDAALVKRLTLHTQGWPAAWYGGETRVKINARDLEGRTALMHAAALGYVKVVEALCDPLHRKGLCEDIDANVKDTDKQRTALHLAALCHIEQVETITALCVHGAAEVGVSDKRGHTPLHLAADRKHAAICRKLLEYNADVNARNEDGNTPLQAAARAGATGALTVLLSHGAHVNAPNEWLDTPLHVALLRYHTVDRGLSIDERSIARLDENPRVDSKRANSPRVNRRRQKERYVFEGVVEQLLKHGADLNLRNKAGLQAFSEPLQKHCFNFNRRRLDRVHADQSRRQIDQPVELVTRTGSWIRSLSDSIGTSSRSLNDEESQRPPLVKRPFSFGSRLTIRESDDDDDGLRHLEGDALYDLLFGDARIQKAVGTVWSRRCFAGSVATLLLYLVFVGCLTALGTACIEGGARRGATSAFATGLAKAFDGESVAARKSNGLSFDDVRSADDVYSFLRTTFHEALAEEAPVRWDGSTKVPLNDRAVLPGFGVVLGRARLTQWRSRSSTCDVPDRLDDVVGFCFRPGADAKPWWRGSKSMLSETAYGLQEEGFVWRSGKKLDRRGISRRLSRESYPAGGFAVDLSSVNATARLHQIDRLEASRWIDAATRAVDIRLTVYNANANLFCRVDFVIEFPAEGGGGVSYVETRAARAWPYLKGGGGGGVADNEDADGSQHTVLGLEIACALLVLFFIGQEIMQFRKERTTYLSNPANLLDWTLFALSVAYFAIRMKQTDGSIGLHDEDGWVAADEQFKWADRHIQVLAAASFVAWARLLQHLRVWRRAAILMLDIIFMVRSLAVWVVFFLLACMAFASAEYILYAWSDDHYGSLATSLGMKFGSPFGEVTYWDILSKRTAGAATRAALTVAYLLTVGLLLMTLLIAMLSEKIVKAHNRSSKFWCFVQHGMVTHHRDNLVSKVSNYFFDCFQRSKDDFVGNLSKLQHRVEHKFDVDADQVWGSRRHAPVVQDLDDDLLDQDDIEGLLKKGDIRGAALTACGHVVEDEDREYHSTPYLARRCSALYPEVAFFVDQTLTDGTSANVEYKNRMQSIEVVVRILSNEKEVEKLSREDVTFLKHELFGPVLGSTAGVAAAPDEARTSYLEARAANLDALLVALACSGVGKVSAFAEDVSRETRLESVDHDRTLRNAMAACPELLPSYRRLAPHLQDRVRRVIGANFNLMQFAQGESLPASLLSLRRLARDRDGPRLCRFALLLWILRVPAFWRVPGLLKNMRGAIEALLRLEDGTVGAARVYDEFLSIRASLLNFAFDAQNRSERHLVRLALMLRLTTPGEAVVLKGAFGLLDLDVQAVLMGELNATGVDDGWGILIYYAPDLLRNVRALAGSNQREGLVAGLSLLARVYVAARQTLDRHPGVGVYTCKVQSLALLAKGTTLAAFETGSSFVLEHFGDEGEVWVASTAPPEEPRSPSPRPRSPTHLL